MTTPRPRRDASARRADAAPKDGGYILVTLALLIIPIISFTALAVDVSSWYSRATELQRAADSAALAGVIWMPNLGQAQTQATSNLAQNNVVDGVNDMSVTIEQGSDQNSLKVCVTDKSAPQYFSMIMSGPESLSRCGTAKYNLPLELGSPLNYYGGNASANLGTYPETTTSTSNSTEPTNGNVNPPDPPNNYLTATVPLAQGGGTRGCYWWGKVSGSKGGRTSMRGYIWLPNNTRLTFNGGGNPRQYINTYKAWTYSGTQYYGDDLPQCTWTLTTTTTIYKPINPIPDTRSPNFWAAIAGPGMFAPNGDAKAPRCKSSGDCSTTDNTMYRPEGYTYSLDVPAGTTSGDVSVQIFDAAVSQTSGTAGTGDTRYGGSYVQHTMFTVWDSGPTPYDTTDDTLVSGCSLTTQGSSVTYDKKWIELCHFTPTVGRRYYINVRSSEPVPNGSPPWGPNGNTYNGYALRAVAGSYPAACLSPTFPQLNSTACYGVDPQPRLSGYTDMEMYNGIPSGVPTQFFIANVKNEYKGKTLVIELWDPGDMACNNRPCGNQSYITVMAPGSSVNGTPQLGCSWASSTATGTNTDSGIIGSSSPCKVQTTTDDNNKFQNQWLQVKINLPAGYSCNELANPTTTGGSCWWQIKYETVNGSLNDYTTWTARIEGDPVRLIQ